MRLKEARELKNSAQILSALWDLAGLWFKYNEYTKSRMCYEELRAELEDASKDVKNMSWQAWDYLSLVGLLKCNKGEGRSREIVECAKGCLELERVNNNQSGELCSLQALAGAMEDLEQWDEAKRAREFQANLTMAVVNQVLDRQVGTLGDVFAGHICEPLQSLCTHALCIALSNLGETYQTIGRAKSYTRKGVALHDFEPPKNIRASVLALKGPKLAAGCTWSEGDTMTVFGGLTPDGYLRVKKDGVRGLVPFTHVKVETDDAGIAMLDLALEQHRRHLKLARKELNRCSECVALANIGNVLQVRDMCIGGTMGQASPRETTDFVEEEAAINYHLLHLQIAQEIKDMELQRIARENIRCVNGLVLPTKEDREALRECMRRARPEPYTDPELILVA